MNHLRAAIAFAIAVTVCSVADADLITVPTNLNEGDQYRLAFVTSGFRDATSTDIADYNTFVNNDTISVAELQSLGTTWFAIASTSTIDARDNTGTNPTSNTGVPIFLLDGTKIADSNADLWNNSIDAPISVTSHGGTFVTPQQVYTGTDDFDGTAHNPMGETFVTFGKTDSTTQWGFSGSTAATTPHALYGISGVLTVSAVPEPSSFLMLAVVGAGVAAIRRRKRVRLVSK